MWKSPYSTLTPTEPILLRLKLRSVWSTKLTIGSVYTAALVSGSNHKLKTILNIPIWNYQRVHLRILQYIAVTEVNIDLREFSVYDLLLYRKVLTELFSNSRTRTDLLGQILAPFGRQAFQISRSQTCCWSQKKQSHWFHRSLLRNYTSKAGFLI